LSVIEISWCYYKMLKYEEAYNFANAAVKMEQNNSSCYYVRGTIENAGKMYEEAKSDLEKGIQLDNKTDKIWSSKLYYQKAWAEYKLSNNTQAQTDIQQALKLCPNQIAYLILAMDIEFFGTKNYYNAQGFCREILKIDSENRRAILAQEKITDMIHDEI
ncbi:hypothetical protein IJG14_07175, partial [bacterium]|nr:hypothetical protein [bacterium]